MQSYAGRSFFADRKSSLASESRLGCVSSSRTQEDRIFPAANIPLWAIEDFPWAVTVQWCRGDPLAWQQTIKAEQGRI